jgi:hypothetical protein
MSPVGARFNIEQGCSRNRQEVSGALVRCGVSKNDRDSQAAVKVKRWDEPASMQSRIRFDWGAVLLKLRKGSLEEPFTPR